MLQGEVAGAEAATARLAWSVVPGVVLPVISIVPPVLLSPAAVTFVDAPSPALPMLRVPLSLFKVPPRVAMLPPTSRCQRSCRR